MDKDEFGEIMQAALEALATETEAHFPIILPRQLMVKVQQGAVHHIMPIAHALDLIYLGDKDFWVKIKLSVVEVDPVAGQTLVAMHPSGHKTPKFEYTWNYKNGLGSFDLHIPDQLKVAQYIEHQGRSTAP